MTFGQNLQRLREKAGLSQSGLASAAGIPVKSIQNWEIDRAQPRLEAIPKLAEALGASVEDLVKFGEHQAGKPARTPKATPAPPPAGDLEEEGKKRHREGTRPPRGRKGK